MLLFLFFHKKKKLKQSAVCLHFSGSLVLLIPTGRHGGVGEFKDITLTNFMVKFFKSGDLLTSKIWGDFGLKPPVP